MPNERKFAVWKGFLRSYNTVLRKLEHDLQAEHGMALTWYDVLVQLQKSPRKGLSMQELAEAVILSQSGLTRLVDRMVNAGLVERHHCEIDRRMCYAKLTADGEARFEQVRPLVRQKVNDYFLQHVDEEAIEILEQTFAKILAS